jgi:hypothetical protein
LFVKKGEGEEEKALRIFSGRSDGGETTVKGLLSPLIVHR